MNIGELVQHRVAELGTNSAEVARRAGLERTFVHDLISGRKKSVTADALVALAVALNCAPEDLVGRPGAIPRDNAEIPISGIVEPKVWRSGPQPSNLGVVSAQNDGSPDTVAYLVRSDDLSEFGILDGTIVTVDRSRPPRHGELVVIERSRDDLREFTIRKIVDTEGRYVLACAHNDPECALAWPSDRPNEKIKIVGRVMRAIKLFPSISG